MIGIVQEMLSYPFMVRGLIVGMLVSLCASLLGVSLVLKRYSMIGVGLSNVGFGALTLAVALKLSPLQIALPVVLIAAILLLKINENSRVKADAAIAVVSTISLSVGVMITALTTGLNVDVCTYLFGTILAMKKVDVYFSIGLSLVVICLYLIFYKKIFAITFDQDFAKAAGVSVERYNQMLAILTGITVVVGMRLMGTMLISCVIIFPALTAMRVVKSFRFVILVSAILSLFSFFLGMLISYEYSLPTGASIVMVNAMLFVVFSVYGMIRRRGI